MRAVLERLGELLVVTADFRWTFRSTAKGTCGQLNLDELISAFIDLRDVIGGLEQLDRCADARSVVRFDC